MTAYRGKKRLLYLQIQEPYAREWVSNVAILSQRFFPRKKWRKVYGSKEHIEIDQHGKSRYRAG